MESREVEFGILTVGALRKRLEGLEDHVNVVILTDDWWDNIRAVDLPDEDGLFTVTLVPGTALDTRQF